MHELIETNPLTVLSINDFLYCDFLVVPAVLKALAYEEMRGSYSVGKLYVTTVFTFQEGQLLYLAFDIMPTKLMKDVFK